MRVRSVCLAIIALLAAACAVPSKTAAPRTAATTATPPADMSLLAQSMLLTVSDFPPGTRVKVRTVPVAAVASCTPAFPAGVVGYADSFDFVRDPSQSAIHERIDVFSNPRDALARLNQYKTDVVDCLANAINQGEANIDSMTLRNAAAKLATFAVPSDNPSATYRLTYDLIANGQAPVTVTTDYAAVAVGRVVYTLDAAPTGFTSDELVPYLERATGKIAQQSK